MIQISCSCFLVLQVLLNRAFSTAVAAWSEVQQQLEGWREFQNGRILAALDMPADILLLAQSPALLQSISMGFVITAYADLINMHSVRSAGSSTTTSSSSSRPNPSHDAGSSSSSNSAKLWQTDGSAGGDWQLACQMCELLPAAHNQLLQLLGCCSTKAAVWVASKV